VIETPGGNKLLLSDEDKKIKIEDQHGNSITMDSNGIKIESAKDFQVKASSDFKAEGVNTSLKGSGQTKIEGGSGAEVSSGGNTAIKGSVVQLN
jgi:phage gp45-like